MAGCASEPPVRERVSARDELRGGLYELLTRHGQTLVGFIMQSTICKAATLLNSGWPAGVDGAVEKRNVGTPGVPNAKIGEWRHVPPKAWERMVPSSERAGAGAMLAR